MKQATEKSLKIIGLIIILLCVAVLKNGEDIFALAGI